MVYSQGTIIKVNHLERIKSQPHDWNYFILKQRKSSTCKVFLKQLTPEEDQRANEAMGQAFRKLLDSILGNTEMGVAMLGLDCAGKTTILYKLQTGDVVTTIPTIGFNVEEIQYKKVKFIVWDVGGPRRISPLLRHFFQKVDGLIYVVDSTDRERIGDSKEEFQIIVNLPFVLNCVILVLANKQDMKEAMTLTEVSEELGLSELKDRKWHIQGSCAVTGDGLCEALDWLACTVKETKNTGWSYSFF